MGSTSSCIALTPNATTTTAGISDFAIRVIDRRLKMFPRLVAGFSRSGLIVNASPLIFSPPDCPAPAISAALKLAVRISPTGSSDGTRILTIARSKSSVPMPLSPNSRLRVYTSSQSERNCRAETPSTRTPASIDTALSSSRLCTKSPFLRAFSLRCSVAFSVPFSLMMPPASPPGPAVP